MWFVLWTATAGAAPSYDQQAAAEYTSGDYEAAQLALVRAIDGHSRKATVDELVLLGRIDATRGDRDGARARLCEASALATTGGEHGKVNGALRAAKIDCATPATIPADLPAAEAPADSPARTAIEAAIQGRAQAVDACYQKRVASQPSLAGAVTVWLVVDGDGTVHGARPAWTDAGLDDLATCVAGAIGDLHVDPPADKAPARVAYPFLFRPE